MVTPAEQVENLLTDLSCATETHWYAVYDNDYKGNRVWFWESSCKYVMPWETVMTLRDGRAQMFTVDNEENIVVRSLREAHEFMKVRLSA
jgi:hypothetical protein